jgi:hypothetical protein
MTIPTSYTNKDLPEHLSPEILMGVLYIHKGKDTEDKLVRAEHVAKKVGDKNAMYVMALLTLPQLIEDTMKSNKYKDFIEERNQRTIN